MNTGSALIGLFIVLAAALGLAAGWLLASRAAARQFAEREAALASESQLQLAKAQAEVSEAQGQVRLLQSERDKLQLEQS